MGQTENIPFPLARESAVDGYFYVQTSGRDVVKKQGQDSFFKGYRAGSGTPPDGVYGEWHWDGRTVEVRTCATGFLPIFYRSSDTDFVVATKLETVADLCRDGLKLDEEALSVFFRLGFFLGNATPFHNIKVLGPNGRITWSFGKRVVQEGYQETQRSSISRDEAVDRYVEVFRAAVERHADLSGDALAVPLSGGRDSRHLALELSRKNVTPSFALTSCLPPPRGNGDVAVAQRLCQHLKWNHTVVDQPFDQFKQEVESIQKTDYQSFEHGWTLTVPSVLKRARIEQAFDGVGGDILSAGLYQDEVAVSLFQEGRLRCVAAYLIGVWDKLGGEAGLKETLGPMLGLAAQRDVALDVIESELALHSEQPNALKSFYFWNRSRRATGLLPFKILGDFTVYAPYLSPEVRTFLLSLPPSLTADKMLHTRTISRAHPDLDAIPYSTEDRVAIPRLSSSLYYSRMSAISAGNLRSRVWRAPFVLPRSARQATTLNTKKPWWNPRRVIYLRELERFLSK